jgi:hypothetical protein
VALSGSGPGSTSPRAQPPQAGGGAPAVPSPAMRVRARWTARIDSSAVPFRIPFRACEPVW